MSYFEWMDFGYDGGHGEMFVVHARKYTAEKAVEICKREYSHLFDSTSKRRLLREPTIDDVQNSYCAFRFGVSSEWPDGCYTFVDENARGAFPVYVIDFNKLKSPKEATDE